VILLWIKITWYKITKVLKGSWSTWCRIHAGAGEEPHVRARVTRTVDGYGIAPKAETSGEVSLQATHFRKGEITGFSREPGAPDDTIKTERLRRLIALGLVSEPAPDLSDFIRMEQWHEEWARREAGDPSACPCGGRHYPEPDACRWCRCHDLRNVHHTAPARGIMQVIPPDLAAEVADEALSNLFERLGPPPYVRDYPGPLFFEEDHEDPGSPDAFKSDSAVRPSDEIVCCPRCDHPQHGENGGRCAFLVPSADTEGPLPVCRCVWTEEQA
jgi:hypothetical protein